MSDESKKYISVIFKEWLPLYDGLKPEVKAILKNIAAEQSEALAARFYDFIFQDPDIARHLTYDLVQERLSRSLAVWVNDILTSEKDQLQALAERQYHIGSIHARIGIPAEAVLRGARQLKAGLIEYVRDNDKIDHQTGLATIHYAVMAINMAIEMMCHAYTLSHYRATKNEEAFRLYSLMDNVPMEYGKQQVSLSGWENSAIFNIVSENKSDINGTLLSESEFGLWFRHKCVRYFNKNAQMEEIADLITQVDNLIAGWKSSDSSAEYKNTQTLLQSIHIHCQKISSQLGVIFSSLSQMQNGKDTLTSLLNRRYLPVVLKHEVTLAMEHELPMTVAIVDIDHFKEINDNWAIWWATGQSSTLPTCSAITSAPAIISFATAAKSFCWCWWKPARPRLLRSLSAYVKALASSRLTSAARPISRLPPVRALPCIPAIRIITGCCATLTARCTWPSAAGATA